MLHIWALWLILESNIGFEPGESLQVFIPSEHQRHFWKLETEAPALFIWRSPTARSDELE